MIASALEPLTLDTIRALPKVELHVHVEACISADHIADLAKAAKVPMLRPKEELFAYDTLAEFLSVYEWWCDLLRTTDIAEGVAYKAAEMLHGQGIVYADVLTGPRYWRHLDYAPLIEALGAGFERAQSDGFTDCRLVPSISREQSAAWGMELVEWIARAKPLRVVGLGLDGNEAVLGRTSHKFEKVFARAAEIGLGRTAHSGESSGPEGVWDAITYLKLDRIDHGVRAIEDPALVERLAADGTTLNICPTSNAMLGLYPSIADNPLARFIDAGVPVTVNSDDPIAMNVTLCQELLKTGEAFHWTLDDAIAVTRNAADAAFCEQAKTEQLHREIDRFETSRAASLSS